jgi:hypothetical protein
MNSEPSLNLILNTGLIGAVCSLSWGGVIAHSANDFVMAMNDGIGSDGGSVVAGGALDVAQQGHTDSSASGSWNYGYGRSGDGGAFSGGFPLLDYWNGSGWQAEPGGVGFVGATGQSPNGSTINANDMTYRRWTSDGAYTGEMLTMEVRVTLASELSDGVTVVLSATGTVADYEVLISPDDFGEEQVFTLDFFDSADGWALAGLRPLGVGPVDATNFFNDSVNIEVTIVPTPGIGAVLALAGLGNIRRRR